MQFVVFINMSKLYDKYEKLKSEDLECIYLFLCGNFYIALDSDAIMLNDVKVNIKMLKKLKIKMYKIFTQFCIGSDTSESIFNLSFKRYEFPFIFITCE